MILGVILIIIYLYFYNFFIFDHNKTIDFESKVVSSENTKLDNACFR